VAGVAGVVSKICIRGNPGGKSWRPSPGNSTSRSTRVSDADRAGQVQPWTPQTSVRQTASRLAFYGGAIALGGLGVVEWPVTLLVMAGTYVADRARPTAEADSVVDASPSSAAESSDSPPDSAALPR